ATTTTAATTSAAAALATTAASAAAISAASAALPVAVPTTSAATAPTTATSLFGHLVKHLKQFLPAATFLNDGRTRAAIKMAAQQPARSKTASQSLSTKWPVGIPPGLLLCTYRAVRERSANHSRPPGNHTVPHERKLLANKPPTRRSTKS